MEDLRQTWKSRPSKAKHHRWPLRPSGLDWVIFVGGVVVIARQNIVRPRDSRAAFGSTDLRMPRIGALGTDRHRSPEAGVESPNQPGARSLGNAEMYSWESVPRTLGGHEGHWPIPRSLLYFQVVPFTASKYFYEEEGIMFKSAPKFRPNSNCWEHN